MEKCFGNYYLTFIKGTASPDLSNDATFSPILSGETVPLNLRHWQPLLSKRIPTYILHSFEEHSKKKYVKFLQKANVITAALILKLSYLI